MQGQEVGGDFYDAFVIDDASWGIAIGDVRGKGPRAASLTALARYTIRALADRGAGQVLTLLNDAVMRDADVLAERFMTAVFAVARRRGDGLELELAAAGHPRPLILRGDGSVEEALASGLLIGVEHNVGYVEARIELHSGDTLLLYTDGLTDARAPGHIVTEGELASLLSGSRGRPPDQIAAYLEEAVTAGVEPRDDIAMLVLTVDGPPLAAEPVQPSASSAFL